MRRVELQVSRRLRRSEPRTGGVAASTRLRRGARSIEDDRIAHGRFHENAEDGQPECRRRGRRRGRRRHRRYIELEGGGGRRGLLFAGRSERRDGRRRRRWSPKSTGQRRREIIGHSLLLQRQRQSRPAGDDQHRDRDHRIPHARGPRRGVRHRRRGQVRRVRRLRRAMRQGSRGPRSGDRDRFGRPDLVRRRTEGPTFGEAHVVRRDGGAGREGGDEGGDIDEYIQDARELSPVRPASMGGRAGARPARIEAVRSSPPDDAGAVASPVRNCGGRGRGPARLRSTGPAPPGADVGGRGGVGSVPRGAPPTDSSRVPRRELDQRGAPTRSGADFYQSCPWLSVRMDHATIDRGPVARIVVARPDGGGLRGDVRRGCRLFSTATHCQHVDDRDRVPRLADRGPAGQERVVPPAPVHPRPPDGEISRTSTDSRGPLPAVVAVQPRPLVAEFGRIGVRHPRIPRGEFVGRVRRAHLLVRRLRTPGGVGVPGSQHPRFPHRIPG
mmetsp:Transcript_35276/g.105376  ORF Transcript_35276/g.105376 Transcript_35276/m.105376 type:complete len:499 (+) Transcript_35276:2080-3576(+)